MNLDNEAPRPSDETTDRGQEPAQRAASSRSAQILTRPGDGFRARRVRKFARRHLDCLLGVGLDPWAWAQPAGDPYRDGHMDRDCLQREYLGRDLAEAGWTP